MTDKKKTKTAVETKEVDSAKKELKKTDAAKKHRKKPHDLIKEIEDKLKTAQEESKATYDRFLRASAEFENHKKRSTREMDEFRKFANESLIKELLPVVDNLERAINSSSNDKQANSALVEGVDMTLKAILKIFEKFKVKPIEALKKHFDPNFHQAVMTEETDDYAEHIVINELRKGYMMHDRLLRPAMVVVSTPKAKSNNEKSTNNKIDKTV
ncbi:MAG: nucleotide exchange factor GrpE [Thermodesulfobacteriota bacterium]|nr:nucleotide exchange factor GrpE [Thermodesulfobacteriota bacterium]